ncbi:GTP cyclohydrolase I [Herbaspirillum sp. SJZ130]|nr:MULTISPECIES: GTP cyclohydrolase FolE2 [unclassified Herbaspirillum]TQK03903.1 GTP cyclohydrolase I [Herbaspirillum sp. SJZ130]TQK08635.1 GTP cyclohydrolase I [Herbaspirillum sp. SJZ106]TWC71906.1 GTP cyclohydrolase I [Herbaspirillum sp. SJZ099]
MGLSVASALPDVARHESSAIALALDWVGMRGIAIPLPPGGRESGSGAPLAATAELAVDLPDPLAKGIHMSRLYRLLGEFARHGELSPRALRRLLLGMIESHADCGSRAARLGLAFDLLQQRPALRTPELAGWQSYPASVQAVQRGHATQVELAVRIQYSSTCPCSAALSRQAVRDAFAADFDDTALVARGDALDWISARASLATPHSQRSEAEVRIRLSPDAAALPVSALIDCAETALATPVQTAVKRADEQAFALLNGANLMYVEDAARRLRRALEQNFGACSVTVSHHESLHPHDAVASCATPGWERID